MNEYEKHNGDENYYFKLCETLEIKLIQKQAEIETLQSYGYRTQYELLRIEFIQQQAEIEALKMGFAGNGTSDSELAKVRAQANRWFLKIKEQQAEIEELKTCLIVEQEHNERMVEDRSKYEALAHAGGVEAGKELTVNEVMAEHCTCYKLGYSPLNDYAAVKQK
jgi:hypothetical protein